MSKFKIIQVHGDTKEFEKLVEDFINQKGIKILSKYFSECFVHPCVTRSAYIEYDLINKPVETTNEQPKITFKQIDDLFDDYFAYTPNAGLKSGKSILELKTDIFRLIV